MAVALPLMPLRLGALSPGALDDWVDALDSRATTLDNKFGRVATAAEVPESVWAGVGGDSVRDVRDRLVSAAKHSDNVLRRAAGAVRDAREEIALIITRRKALEDDYRRLQARAASIDPSVDAAGAAAVEAEAHLLVQRAEARNAEAAAVLDALRGRLGEASTSLGGHAERLRSIDDELRGGGDTTEGSPGGLDRFGRRQAGALVRATRDPRFDTLSGLLASVGLRDLLAAKMAGDETLVNFGGGLATTMGLVTQYRRVVEAWETLTPAQRTGGLGDVLNAALTGFGMDPVNVGYGAMVDRVIGTYAPLSNTIRFANSLVTKATLDPNDELTLFTIMVHETTHAVQFQRFGELRVAAGLGPVDVDTPVPEAASVDQPWARDPQIVHLAELQWAQFYNRAELVAGAKAYPASLTPEAEAMYRCSPLEWEAYREGAAAETLYAFLSFGILPSSRRNLMPPFACEADPLLPSAFLDKMTAEGISW